MRPPIFELNEIFSKLLSDSKLGQTSFGNIVGLSQPVIFNYVHNKTELRYSDFIRFCRALGVEYRIVLSNDESIVEYNLVSSLKSSEVKLVKSFSSEIDFDKKLKILNKINAVKLLLEDSEKENHQNFIITA